MTAFHGDSWLMGKKEGAKHGPALKYSGLGRIRGHFRLGEQPTSVHNR